ncbi:MAG: hypothetical protein O7H41_00105 [Planctomycetota bacterium]|nr:hypothetical protein [Planctomycetota bacterium]
MKKMYEERRDADGGCLEDLLSSGWPEDRAVGRLQEVRFKRLSLQGVIKQPGQPLENLHLSLAEGVRPETVDNEETSHNLPPDNDGDAKGGTPVQTAGGRFIAYIATSRT